MKKLLFTGFAFVLIVLSKDCFSTAYYTRASGNWTGSIWSTSSSGGTIITLPALNDGDFLYINHNVTITTNLDYLSADLTIYLDATLTINGTLRVGAASVFIFPSASGILTSTASGNNARLFIGTGNGNAGADWSSGRPTVTGPGSFGDGWDCPPCVLPITLTSFYAAVAGDAVTLSWATSMEERFSRFIVQRADRELLFENIGEVAGRGFDIYNVESQYSFTDKAPLLGLSYYRLKAIDIDETFEYFGPKVVRIEGDKRIEAFPNPSLGHEISLRYNFHPEESDRIIVMNQLGVELFNFPATSAEKIVFSEKLSPGIYLVRYHSGRMEHVSHIVVSE